jgi:hypothetical protein
MIASPAASKYTGVLREFFAKKTVTPAGILTVVKLNFPSGGTVNTTSVVGLNGPSAPVLPLLNPACTTPIGTARPTTTNVARCASEFGFMVLLPHRSALELNNPSTSLLENPMDD